MQCPKCGAEQPDGEAICARCGIVFEKYYKYHPRLGEAEPAAGSRSASARRLAQRPLVGSDEKSGGISDLLVPETQSGDWPGLGARGLLWVVLLVWGLYLMLASVASNTAGESFLHLVNLPFHEFGHILSRPFGAHIASLGGTLGQLLMPAICCGVLLIQTRDPFGASVTFWWFGENYLDIAPYIDDARAGQLPLVGGNYGE